MRSCQRIISLGTFLQVCMFESSNVVKTICAIIGVILFLIIFAGFALAWYMRRGRIRISPEESALLLARSAESIDSSDEYTVSRERAHPNAVELMKEEWFWSIIDENSPFGNDDGADALAIYRRWRAANPEERTIDRVVRVCHRLEIPF